MTRKELKRIENAYKEVAKKSRETKIIKIESMGPDIHGIRRMPLIPAYAMNASWHVRPLIIRGYKKINKI